MCAYLTKGKRTRIAFVTVRVSNFLVFSLNICLIGIMSYLIYVSLRQAGLKKRMYWCYIDLIILLVDFLQLIVNIFTRHLYFFDSHNFYHRGDFYSIFVGLQFIVLFIDFIAVIHYRKWLTKKEIFSYMSFILLPALATIWVMFHYGISLTNLAAFTSLLIVVFMLALDDSEKMMFMQDNIIRDFAGVIESRSGSEDASANILIEERYVEEIGKQMVRKKLYPKEMTLEHVERMTKASPLHDIGKITIPDYILNKEGKLSDEEYEIVKKHPTEGMKILSRTIMSVGEGGYVEDAIDMAWCHHERWDGNGYPQGLKGEDIPLTARVMAVADVFNALTSDRSYRKAYSFDEAIKIMKEEAGRQLDAKLLI